MFYGLKGLDDNIAVNIKHEFMQLKLCWFEALPSNPPHIYNCKYNYNYNPIPTQLQNTSLHLNYSNIVLQYYSTIIVLKTKTSNYRYSHTCREWQENRLCLQKVQLHLYIYINVHSNKLERAPEAVKESIFSATQFLHQQTFS